MQTNFIELSVDMSMVGDISYLSKSNAGSSTFLKLTSTGYIEYYPRWSRTGDRAFQP